MIGVKIGQRTRCQERQLCPPGRTGASWGSQGTQPDTLRPHALRLGCARTPGRGGHWGNPPDLQDAGSRASPAGRGTLCRGVPGHGTAPRRGRAADGSPGAGSASGQFPRAGKSSKKRKSPNSQKPRLVLSGNREGQEWGCPRRYHRLGPILQGPMALGAPRGCPN